MTVPLASDYTQGPPDEVYLAASRAQNVFWGYEETLDRDHFERVVARGAINPALRLVVNTVWAMATAPARRISRTLRAQIAAEIRAVRPSNPQLGTYAAATERAALIAEGATNPRKRKP